MDELVNFEIANLLKNKRLNIKASKGYYKHGDRQLLLWVDSENYNNQEDFICYAPTIAKVVMGLLEKHGIWIHVNVVPDNMWGYIVSYLEELDPINEHVSLYMRAKNINPFNSPTEAYLAAILSTLNKLK